MRKKFLLLCLGLLLFVVGWAVKSRQKEPALPYAVPKHEAAAASELSKLDEYEQILAGQAPRPLQAQTQAARFSFSSLFKPNQPTKEPVVEAQQPPKPQQQYFFSYGAQGASSALPKAPASEQHFIKASIYKEQKVQDGAGVVLKLQKPCPQGPLTLPAGTLLYGAARFARNRLLLTLTAAQYKDQRLPVLLTCYDTDLLPGLYYEGISAWERPQEQALDKALGHTDAGLLKELGQGAVSAWKTLRKKQTATLEDGRQLYVQPKDKR